MPLITFKPLHYVNNRLIYNQETHDFLKKVTDFIPRIATFITTVDVPNIAAGATATVTITVNGITTEDIIYVNQPNLSGIALVTYRVTAANTVDLFFWNPTGGAINPASATFKLVAIRR
jgi:hypothetical protein